MPSIMIMILLASIISTVVPLDTSNGVFAAVTESSRTLEADVAFRIPNRRTGTARAAFSKAAFQFPFPRRVRKTTMSSLKSLPRTADQAPITETNEALRQAIQNLVSIIHEPLPTTTQSSIVHIIGTGLSPTLLDLPLSTLRILSQADVVLHDSLGLSRQDIRRIVPTHCDVIGVGKRGDEKSWKQQDIDELLLQVALEPVLPSSAANTTQPTKCIVRLKGGDPFLFGRTRTEIDSLRSQGIPYSYTPGISSCIAGPHLGGIPLTDALLDCQSFGVWSGTDAFGRSWGLAEEASDKKQWHGLEVDVLVFLMVGRLDKLEALCRAIARGAGDSVLAATATQKWSNDTPCAVIQNAGGRTKAGPSSSPIQRVWRSTLQQIVPVIREEDNTRTSVSPAVFVVGATAALNLLSQDSQH